jgi:hypothetical protein
MLIYRVLRAFQIANEAVMRALMIDHAGEGDETANLLPFSSKKGDCERSSSTPPA